MVGDGNVEIVSQIKNINVKRKDGIVMLTERDRNYIERMLAQVSYHQNGGTERHIPKTGKHRDLCMRGIGNGRGQVQGYLLAMREHGLLTEEEWMGYMTQYVYARA